MKRVLLLCAAGLLALTACDNPSGGDEGIVLVQLMPGDRTIAVGEVLELEPVVRDESGEEPDEDRLADIEWSSSAPGVATVNGAGEVTGVAPGTATIRAVLDGVAGEVVVNVAAAPAACTAGGAVRSLAVGEAFTMGGIAASNLCLDGGATGKEYVLVPFNGADQGTGSSNVWLNAQGIVPVAAASPALLGPALGEETGRERDLDFHWRLRERAAADLAQHVDAALATRGAARDPLRPSFALDLRNPTVGQQVQVNVSLESCGTPDLHTARVAAVSQRAIILADVANPAGGLTDAEYASFALGMDTLVYPTVTESFGTPKDLDGNGRVIIFYTRAVNELTPRGSTAYVGGFFHPRDLFPTRDADGLSACQGTNYAEIFYMLVPDPGGAVNGNVFPRELILGTSLGTVAHEFQHLINAARRLYDVGTNHWNEETWLNEAMSHVGEEVLFYRAAGMAPRQNLTAAQVFANPRRTNAFNTFMDQNLRRLQHYLEDPEAESPYDTLAGDDNDLPTRGASWAFLRYAADRRGGSDPALWNDLIESSTTGFANLQQALGADARQWVRDWTASVFADDVVTGLEARFQQPSWHYRSFYSPYPLRTRRLAGPSTTNVSVKAGGGAFFRFGVAASGTGTLQVRAGPTTPLASPVFVTVIRTK